MRICSSGRVLGALVTADLGLRLARSWDKLWGTFVNRLGPAYLNNSPWCSAARRRSPKRNGGARTGIQALDRFVINPPSVLGADCGERGVNICNKSPDTERLIRVGAAGGLVVPPIKVQHGLLIFAADDAVCDLRHCGHRSAG